MKPCNRLDAVGLRGTSWRLSVAEDDRPRDGSRGVVTRWSEMAAVPAARRPIAQEQTLPSRTRYEPTATCWTSSGRPWFVAFAYAVSAGSGTFAALDLPAAAR